MRRLIKLSMVLLVILLHINSPTLGVSEVSKDNIYNLGKLKPIDSVLKVKVGELAPDFILPAVSGQFRPVP